MCCISACREQKFAWLHFQLHRTNNYSIKYFKKQTDCVHFAYCIFLAYYYHRLYIISGRSHHDVTHRFVQYCFEVSSLALWPLPFDFFESSRNTVIVLLCSARETSVACLSVLGRGIPPLQFSQRFLIFP